LAFIKAAILLQLLLHHPFWGKCRLFGGGGPVEKLSMFLLPIVRLLWSVPHRLHPQANGFVDDPMRVELISQREVVLLTIGSHAILLNSLYYVFITPCGWVLEHI
jgi:hypothetical protein